MTLLIEVGLQAMPSLLAEPPTSSVATRPTQRPRPPILVSSTQKIWAAQYHFLRRAEEQEQPCSVELLEEVMNPASDGSKTAAEEAQPKSPARAGGSSTESDWDVLGEVDLRSNRASAPSPAPPLVIAHTTTTQRHRRSGSRRRVGQPSSFVVASSLARAAFNDAQESESALFVDDKEMETSILLELARLRFQIAQSHKALDVERIHAVPSLVPAAAGGDTERRRRELFGIDPLISQQPMRVDESNASDAVCGFYCIKPEKRVVSDSWPAPHSGTPMSSLPSTTPSPSPSTSPALSPLALPMALMAEDKSTDAFTRSTSAAKVALETSAAATRDALGVGLEVTRVAALAPVALAAVATIKLSQTIGSGIGSGLEATRDAADHVIIVAGDEILWQGEASSSALSKGFAAMGDALRPQQAAGFIAAQESEQHLDFAADFGGDASNTPDSTHLGHRSPSTGAGLPGSMPPTAARHLDDEMAATEATQRGLATQPSLPRRLTLDELLAQEAEEARAMEARAAAAKVAEETAHAKKRAGATGSTERAEHKPSGAWAAARKLYHGSMANWSKGMGDGTRGYQPLTEALRSKDDQLVEILRRKRASTAAAEGANTPPVNVPVEPSDQALEALAARGRASAHLDLQGDAASVESMVHGHMDGVDEEIRHMHDEDDGDDEASAPLASPMQSSRHLARIRSAKRLGGTSTPPALPSHDFGRPVSKRRLFHEGPEIHAASDSRDTDRQEIPPPPPSSAPPTRRSSSLWRMLPRSLSIPGRHASGGDTLSKPRQRVWSALGRFRRSSSRLVATTDACLDDTIMRT